MQIYWDDHLEHHGIKGQRWGVRRYQNSDGTLTEAGKKRYWNPDGSLNKAGKQKYDELRVERVRAQESSKYYADKANKHKAKVPAHYFTEFGKAKAEKHTKKAASYDGKSYEFAEYAKHLTKQIDSLNEKEVNRGKEKMSAYLEANRYMEANLSKIYNEKGIKNYYSENSSATEFKDAQRELYRVDPEFRKLLDKAKNI